MIDPGARQAPSCRAMENVNIMSITQIIIQSQYARSPEAIAIRTAITLDRAGIRVVNSDDPGCDISELPVGSVEFVLSGLRKRLVKAPPVIDYPAPLKRFLLREIRSSILINEIGGEAWIKTRGHEKSFEPGAANRPNLCGINPQTLVYASPFVRWLCEWRCYVANGRLLWRERYDPDGPDDAPEPSERVIQEMLGAYESSGDAPAGYVMDVGVLENGKSALIEINDGYAIGFYGKITPQRSRDYLRVLIARYEQIIGSLKL